MSGFYDVAHIVFYWIVQYTVTDKIYKMMRIDTGMVFLKAIWMLRDKRNDIVHFLLWRLETAFSVCCHNELVSSDPASIAVKTYI